MFTGIIQKVAPVTGAEKTPQDQPRSMKITVATGFSDLQLGESIAINGVCLTVTEFTPSGEALFYVSQETLDRTQLGELAARAKVNIERALSLQDRLSGHLVQGHVDGLGRLAQIRPVGESREIEIEVPATLSRYCIEKGSIAVNGVSLTMNSVTPTSDHGCSIRINLIPHTWENTNFHTLSEGSLLNLETDVFAKWIEKLCRPYLKL